MLAGAMGWLPDDPRIFRATEIARAAGIEYGYEFGEMKESTHINAIKFILTGTSGKVATLVGDSTGGGMVETRVVNGYPLHENYLYPGDAPSDQEFDVTVPYGSLWVMGDHRSDSNDSRKQPAATDFSRRN